MFYSWFQICTFKFIFANISAIIITHALCYLTAYCLQIVNKKQSSPRLFLKWTFSTIIIVDQTFRLVGNRDSICSWDRRFFQHKVYQSQSSPVRSGVLPAFSKPLSRVQEHKLFERLVPSWSKCSYPFQAIEKKTRAEKNTVEINW